VPTGKAEGTPPLTDKPSPPKRRSERASAFVLPLFSIECAPTLNLGPLCHWWEYSSMPAAPATRTLAFGGHHSSVWRNRRLECRNV
jgi:hypothetical protein